MLEKESEYYRSEQRSAKLERTLAQRQPGLVVVLENIHDPHNVAAILRSCDAVGVLRVAMLYTIEQMPKLGNSPTAASGVMKWLEFEKYSSVKECYDTLHNDGLQILATKLDPGAKQLYQHDLSLPTAIVLGNEHRGISEEAAKQADGLLYIPMMGMAESVNVSVAAAVCLFESLRQRQAKQMYDQPQLPSDDLRSKMQSWLRK
jgi:tRNA (guanosine-2'-O-)-methyltransferase